ncbi:T9SS type A sorting domain-containing protein [Flavobacterium sp.]|uniref:T9SS type A sorting domain-containing protein n=1 Tax=Flavobacterium sp. TaxID=239 RepID=UPI003918DA30
MKKLFFLALCMTLSFHTKAQDDDAAAPKQLDSLLVDIDKSLVTSGIIYERTTPFADLYNFNSKDSSNTADYSYFRQSMLEMYRASNGQKFISLDSLTVNLKNGLLTNNVVDVGILNTQFNIINYHEDNPANGGLLLDSIARKFVQIPNQVPFYMMHNTVVSPLKDAVSGSEIVYRFNKSFFYTNGSKEIKNLTVDFGEGTIKNIVTNGVFIDQEITTAYATNGTKTIKCTILYSDGTTMVTRGEIYFRNTNLSPSETLSCGAIGPTDYRQDFNNQLAAIDRQGYNASDPRIRAQMNYRVFYSDGNSARLIKKPLIIIDGFDPGDTRRIEDCDCEMDESCASKNETAGVFDPIKHKSITDMMVYYDNGVQNPLLKELRDLGYDVIIVNFPNYQATNLNNGQSVDIDGGAYYIETNAMAIVKLIQDVKTQVANNGSTNQIAIIAPSMAGQISRYALSFMEKKFEETALPVWQHNVYLWVSVDSPHLGANIPLGDQAVLGLVKSSNAAAENFYNKQLNSPAAKQQLIEFHGRRAIPNPSMNPPFLYDYHVAEPSLLNAQTTSQGMSSDRGNNYFKMHYDNQNGNGVTGSSGWPMSLRKISVVNGSLSGSKEVNGLNGQPIIGSNGDEIKFAQDGERVLNIRGFQRVRINLGLGSITWYIHIASLESQFMPSTGSTGRVCRFKKLLDDKTTIATNLNPRGVMDNVPGGFYGAQQLIADPTLATNPVPGTSIMNDISITNFLFSLSQVLGGSKWSLREFNPIHSFIPTFSALAHLNPNQSWANPLEYNLVCANETPFDSYFGGSKNTQHTSFTKESVDWLLEELAGNPQLPVYPISLDDVIIGSDELCIGQTKTYSLDNGDDLCRLPSGATWTTSNVIVNSQNPNNITVTGVSDDEASITATFGNGIQSTIYLHAGGPSLNHFTCNTVGGLDFCSGQVYANVPRNNVDDRITAHFDGMSSTEAADQSNWQWEVINSKVEIRHPSIRNNCILKLLNYGPTGVRVRARNSGCGWGRWEYLTFNISPSAERQAMYKVFPNPSSDIVTVDLENPGVIPNSTDIITGELFDLMGYSKGEISINNNQATFSVSSLNTGIYVLKIFINGVPESHQIAVP